MSDIITTSSEALRRERLKLLREPFPASKIQQLDTGRGFTLSYVGHADVTERLLDVDPEWSWEPLGYDANGLPAFDEHGGLWIKLTVLGVTRIGYGEPQGRDEWDKRKGAIGNAIRVAAMRFGVGLQLWQKETTPLDIIERKHAEQLPEKGEWQTRNKASNGARKCSEAQIKLVKSVLGKALNVWDEVSHAGALSQLLGREVANYADLFMGDVDVVKHAKPEDLKRHYFASMGMEIIENSTAAPLEDVWAVDGL